MKYLQVKLEDKIHNKFKLKTIQDQSDMSTIIRKFICTYIESNQEDE